MMLDEVRASPRLQKAGLLFDLAIAVAQAVLFCVTLYLGWAGIGVKGKIASLVALAAYAGLVLGIFTQLGRVKDEEEGLSDAAQLIALSRRSML